MHAIWSFAIAFWMFWFPQVVVRVPGPGGAVANGGSSNVMLADLLMNMNTSSPGTTVTTTILGNGSIGTAGVGAWSLSATPLTGLTVGTSQVGTALPSAVIVNGASYPTTTTHQSIAYDDSKAMIYFQNALLPGHQTIVTGHWLVPGPPVNGAATDTFDTIRIDDGPGNYCIEQLKDGQGSGAYGLDAESLSVPSTKIIVNPGSLYWVSLKADEPNSLCSIAVFDSTMTQVGSTQSVASGTGHVWTNFKLGNLQTGTSMGTTYLENVLVDMSTGKFPMKPDAKPPVYVIASASNDTQISGTTVAATLPPTTTGDTIWCPCFWGSTSKTGSVADTANGTYTAVDSPVTVIGSYRAQSFYKTNITGATTPAVTLTLSGTAATTDRAIACMIIHGVTSLDKHPAVHTGTSGTMTSSASTTTSSANEFLGGWCVANGTTTDPYVMSSAPPPVWSMNEFTNFESNPVGSAVVSSTGSYTFTGIQSTSTTFGCGINTFK